MRTAVFLLISLLSVGAQGQNEPAPPLPQSPPSTPATLPVVQITSPPTRAQQLFGSNHPHAIAVFDVTGDTNNLNKTLFFPVPTTVVLQQIQNLKSTMSGAEADVVLSALKKEVKATSDRWISTKGDVVDIYVLYTTLGKMPEISIKEEDRDTRLSTDLATLVKIVKNIAFEAKPKVGVIAREYELTKTRATLTITVTQKATDTPTTVEKSIVTGPTEHLFLSADVPITKVKELKYDDTSKTFTTKDAPTAVYGGFNYTLGDILTTDQQQVWEGVVLKLLLKLSKRPLDGYGAAIGYRSPNIGILGFTLQSFTPFVGYFRTNVSDKDSSGNAITKRKNGVRFGVSFNIDKAVDWTKKKGT